MEFNTTSFFHLTIYCESSLKSVIFSFGLEVLYLSNNSEHKSIALTPEIFFNF
nr:MAG TPA: hypothetical protein [Caudoviricetes sp.]